VEVEVVDGGDGDGNGGSEGVCLQWAGVAGQQERVWRVLFFDGGVDDVDVDVDGLLDNAHLTCRIFPLI
jgi:hypothetical protein